MKENNSISPLDLSTTLHLDVKVVVQRLIAFLAKQGFKNNFSPVHVGFPRIVQQDRSEKEVIEGIRRQASRRGMDAKWCDNLECVTSALWQFFSENQSKLYPLGVPNLDLGDISVPLTTGGYARKDVKLKSARVGVVILRSSFPGATPSSESVRNLASIIHHTQHRRLKDQLFGASIDKMPKVELLIRRGEGSSISFDHLPDTMIELLTEDELERLLTVFLQALDILGSRRLSELKAKYRPKRDSNGRETPTPFGF